MNTECARCTRPVATGMYACAACIAQTDDNMAFIEANANELDTTITRQDRVSAGTGGRASAETPLPLNLAASDAGHRLRNALTTWTRLVADDLGTSLEEAFPICEHEAGSWCTHQRCRQNRSKGGVLVNEYHVSNADMAAWLRKRLKTIAHREWGPECFDELSRAAVDLARAVDSPPPMIALGRCDREDCGTELRARQEATFVRCTECRETYDVARRKDELVVRAGHLNMTPTNLARVVTAATGVELKVQNVYNWANRKYLTRRGTDASGKAVYSLRVTWDLHQKAIQRVILNAQHSTADRVAVYEEAA